MTGTLFGGRLYAGMLWDGALWAWGNAWGGWTAEIEWPKPGRTRLRKVVLEPVYSPTPKRWTEEDDELLTMVGAL